MEILKLDGLILRSFPYSETSQIIHLLTGKGKIAALAKGANRPKSQFAGKLQPLYRIRAIVQRKESREMDILTDAEIIMPYKNMIQDYEKMVFGMAIVETAGRLFFEGQDTELEYNEIVTLLYDLDVAESKYINYFFFFLHSLIKNSGFEISIQSCKSCNKKNYNEAVFFNFTTGDYICGECLSKNYQKANMHSDRLKALRALAEKKHPVLNFNREAQEKILNFYLAYIRAHWESDFKLKSLELLNHKQ